MNHVVAIENNPWTPEQIKLITDTVAKGATADELSLFLYRCKILGLDPLKPGQIHFIKYGNSPGTIVVGIEGFRSKAARTGKLSGIKRGVLRDEKGKCVGAWAEVYRSDWQHSAREEVSLSEYNTGKSAWAKMPETMIKKVAEAATLRMAFPDDLGGVYAPEEMEQAENKSFVGQPGPEDGNRTEQIYRFSFGQYSGKTVEEIYNSNHPKCGPDGLKGYVAYLDEQEKKKGLSPAAIEARRHIEEFLGAVENQPLEEGVL